MLTDFYNIWHKVYLVNVQHNHYLFTHLSDLLLLHYLGKHWMWLESSWQGKVTRGCTNQMPYLCQDARASFLLILALRMMAVITAMSYWCSRYCHPFVPLLVTLTYSSKTVHQRTVRVRRLSSFSVKLRNRLLQTYGLQIVLIVTQYNMRCCAGLRLSDARRRCERSETALDWHMERTEYRC